MKAKKFIGVIIFLVIFVWVGNIVLEAKVKDNPAVSQGDIAYIKECTDGINDNPIGKIPMIFGHKSAVENETKSGGSAVVKYYLIYAIPYYTVATDGKGGCYLAG